MATKKTPDLPEDGNHPVVGHEPESPSAEATEVRDQVTEEFPEPARTEFPDTESAEPVTVAAAAAPAGGGAGTVPPIVPVAPHGGIRGAWSRAWSTTGGKVATLAVIALGVLGLLSALGLGAFAVAKHRSMADGRGNGQMGQGNWGMGQGHGRDGMGQGKGRGGMDCPGNGQGRQGQGGMGPGQGQNGMPGMPGQGMGPGQGQNGMPGMPGGHGVTAMLGTALHGEFVANGADGKAVTYVLQTGTVTAYTRGSAIEIKSSDGFTAKYVLKNTPGIGGLPAVGSVSQIIAVKDGMVATMVMSGDAVVGNGTNASGNTGFGA